MTTNAAKAHSKTAAKPASLAHAGSPARQTTIDFHRVTLRSLFAWGAAHGISAHARSVLVYLAAHANVERGGVAWPLQTSIARDVGISLSTVERALRELADAGAITATYRRAGRSPRGRSYRVSALSPVSLSTRHRDGLEDLSTRQGDGSNPSQGRVASEGRREGEENARARADARPSETARAPAGAVPAPPSGSPPMGTQTPDNRGREPAAPLTGSPQVAPATLGELLGAIHYSPAFARTITGWGITVPTAPQSSEKGPSAA